MHHPRIIWSGDRTLHLALAEGHGDAHAERIVNVFKAIRDEAVAGVIDLTPASTTVQITIDPGAADPVAIANEALRIARTCALRNSAHESQRTIEIPVCYDSDLAPDLEAIASGAGLSTSDAAALHASAVYTVRFLGFSPGFAYLAGLPAALHAARLDSPRPRVRAGSVGVAGARCGIYPSETPGGWRLIGATPLPMFDAQRPDPCSLRAGDRVRFRAITREEYDATHAVERSS